MCILFVVIYCLLYCVNEVQGASEAHGVSHSVLHMLTGSPKRWSMTWKLNLGGGPMDAHMFFTYQPKPDTSLRHLSLRRAVLRSAG